nr:isochorismatase family protein [Clostridium estertheticum]
MYRTTLDATACVYKTSIGAINKGYKAIVLEDALVTSNMGRMPKILEGYSNKGILLTTVQNFMS